MTDYNDMARSSVQKLCDLFHTRLCKISDKVYAPLLSIGVVGREEMENEIRKYYEKRRSGLNEIYSYYSQQWDAYNVISQKNGRDFVNELSRLLPAFSRHYQMSEFNVEYYYGMLSTMSVDDKRWNEVRLQFMNRWGSKLYAKELEYQTQHIERLCDDYFRIISSSVSNLENKVRKGNKMAMRLGWLQSSQSPEMKTRIRQLADIMSGDSLIKEIIDYLGRCEREAYKVYNATPGDGVASDYKSATPSDIEGVSAGDRLNSLLPSEYCYLSEEKLYPFFLKKYTEKKLQIFNTHSHETTTVCKDDSATGKFTLPARRGPFVVCVDTSGSMAGRKELVAKAITLALVLHSESRGRKCRIILFSDRVQSIEIANVYNDIHLLEDFIVPSFHGGTDFSCALDEAVSVLSSEDYSYADMLWISDFEINPVDSRMLSSIIKLKMRDVHFYSVVMSDNPGISFLEYADKVWLRV